jgi:hypothetical protein
VATVSEPYSFGKQEFQMNKSCKYFFFTDEACINAQRRWSGCQAALSWDITRNDMIFLRQRAEKVRSIRKQSKRKSARASNPTTSLLSIRGPSSHSGTPIRRGGTPEKRSVMRAALTYQQQTPRQKEYYFQKQKSMRASTSPNTRRLRSDQGN